MKKNFFYGMLVALGVMAFVGCTTDDTLDTVKIPLSGKTKTLLVTPAIDQTRTTLTADHKLLWAEGDRFGILAAQGTTILKNVPSDPYSSDKEEYTIEIPEETDHIYCYYPYSDENDALAQKDISEFTFTLPSQISHETLEKVGYQGEFLPQYHFMVADSEVKDNENLVFAKFKPVVSIVEFVIYDYDETDAADDVSDSLKNLAFSSESQYIAGTFGVDFAAATLSAEPKEKTGATQVDIAFSEESYLPIPKKDFKTDKETPRTPVYITVPKGELYNATLTLSTEKHPDENYFDQLKWSNTLDLKADGKTVLVNMKHAKPTPMAVIKDITANNPYWVEAPVLVTDECGFIAVYAFPTAEYDESTFRTTAAEIYSQYSSRSMNAYTEVEYAFYDGYYDARDGYTEWWWGPYGKNHYAIIIPVEGELLHYDGLYDGMKFLQTKNSALKPDTDYTYAVYALSNGVNPKHPEPEVYTKTFHTPAVEYNGTGTLDIDVRVSGSRATITVTGTNIDKLVTWNSNVSDMLDSEILTNAVSENRFQSFNGSYEMSQTLNLNETRYYFAVGLDKDGKLVKAEVKSAQPEVIKYTEDIELTNIVTLQQSELNQLTIKMDVDSDIKEVRAFCWRKIEYEGGSETEPNGKTVNVYEPVDWKSRVVDGFKMATNYAYSIATIKDGQASITMRLRGYQNADIPDLYKAEGGQEYYIFIVGADGEGADAGALTPIYQVQGSFDDVTINTITDPYTNEPSKTLYKAATPKELGEGGDDGDEDEDDDPENATLWADVSCSPSFSNANALWLYSAGAKGKGWWFSLGSLNDHKDWYYGKDGDCHLYAIKRMNEIFAEYRTTGNPIEARELVHTFDTFPKAVSAGTFPVASTPWLSSIAVNDVYVVVFEVESSITETNAPLCGKLLFTGHNGTKFTFQILIIEEKDYK